MVSRSEDYVEYCRETARHLHNIQDLALRGKDKQAVTRRIQERIVREVELRPDDDLLDVGCGDGTLLQLAQRIGVRNLTGLLATEEEVAIVRRLGLNVSQGFTDRLPVPDNTASVVVCNNVLLVVPREKIPASLRELHRVAKQGARIFIGEIPLEPGPPPEPEFPTARETLAYLYRQHGFRTWFGMSRRMLYWKLTGQPMVIRGGSTISFFAEPSEFAALAADAGLELVRCWQHDDWPANRYNYLFRKATATPAAATAETAPFSSPAA